MGNDGVKAQWGGSSYISIHVPSWGTTASGDPSTAPDRISIHVPSWGTTIHRHAEVDYVQFQSTFPRGERRLSYEATSRDMSISIHVPSWGTTRSLFDLPFPLPISIHVPSWGTTSMLAGCGKAYPFQSTFPRGERLYSSRNLYHC